MHSITFIFPGWVSKVLGGAEWQMYLLTEELIKRNYNINVITEKPNLYCINYEFINKNVKYIYYKRSKSELVNFIRALRIISLHKTSLYYIRADNRIYRTACGLICTITGRKMIYAIAGDDELEYNSFKINKDVDILVKIFRFFDYGFVNMLTRKSEHRADLIITQTNFQQHNLKIKKGLNSIVIRNSIKLKLYSTDIHLKENLVIWVGNFRRVKQPEVFIDVAKNLLESKSRFVMIGSTGDYIFKDLPSNLEIRGTMAKNEIEKYLIKAKILVNTSITEGFSNTFLEAWIHNIFVISLNVNPDDFLNGDLGVCTNGNFQMLINKIHEILNNDNFNFSHIGNYFRRIYPEFDLNNNILKFINAIKSLT